MESTRIAAIAVAGLSVMGVAACASLIGLGSVDYDASKDASATDAMHADAPPDAPLCASHGGPTMVLFSNEVTAPFCIDSTEVSAAQYEVFLNNVSAKLPTLPIDAGRYVDRDCLVPNTYSMPCSGTEPDPTSNLPIQMVDLMDAYAFCIWAGKRLCTPEEWPTACETGSKGPSTKPTSRCNTAQGALPWPVGGDGGCEGSVANLFDMIGNVEEIVDACDGGACSCDDGGCKYRVLGGAPGGDDSCSFSDNVFPGGAVGFRCCATP